MALLCLCLKRTQNFAAVQGDYDKLAFNKAVARIYETRQHACFAAHSGSSGHADPAMLQRFGSGSYSYKIVAPMMPHLAVECWTVLGK